MVQTTQPSFSKRQKQREILLAAARAFRRKGLESTGMRDIAAELDMAVGNLYYYFRDKKELLAFCQEDALSSLLRLAERVQLMPVGADEKLSQLIAGHIRCLHEGTPGAAAHLEVDALAEPRRPGVVEQRDRYEAEFRKILKEGSQDGTFRAIDPELATRAILGALNWTAKWYNPEGPIGVAEVGQQFSDLLLGGLRSSSTPNSTDTASSQLREKK